MKQSLTRVPFLLALACALASACGGSNGDTGPTETGQACRVAADCYPGVDVASIQGEVSCLDRVPNGYCTHACVTDSDCCAATGECPFGYPEVCSPFESSGETSCFLSCERADLERAGLTDSTVFCQKYANASFICRSSGGGSANRKVCVPDG